MAGTPGDRRRPETNGEDEAAAGNRTGILSNPKTLLILIAGVAAFAVSVLGGALGESFGFGWLGGPIAAIQLPAEKVFTLGFYTVKNTSLMFWAAGLILVLLAFFGTRKIRSGSPDAEVPTGLQNILEVIVEFFIGLAEGAAGGRAGRRFLPLVLAIFLVVLTSNWLGTLPGVGTIGWIETSEELLEHHEGEEGEGPKLVVFKGDGGFKWIPFGSGEGDKIPLGALHLEEKEGADPEHPIVEVKVDESALPEDFDQAVLAEAERAEFKSVGILVPYLRGASTDVNTTLAIAIVAMITVQFWGFRSLGLKGYGGKFINLRQGPIFFAVGLLEIISEISRVISFTFRLFGNMFAGEVLLVAMAFLFPLIGIIPFIGLELFVGVIQAFIFAMLTLVFGVMATVGHGEEEH